MKPSDIYVGVIDLFAILLPGSILTAFLASTAIPGQLKQLGLLPGSEESSVKWVTFGLAAYALGHIVFLVAAAIDPLYDSYRKLRWPDDATSAYTIATRLAEEDLGKLSAVGAMNTFSWAKSLLLIENPQILGTVQRFEADSKFFRSLLVVFVVLAVAIAGQGESVYAIFCLAFAIPAFLRYAERRYKSTEWAYRYVITLKTRTGNAQVVGKEPTLSPERFESTELRWFIPGSPPDDLAGLFRLEPGSPSPHVDERPDIYSVSTDEALNLKLRGDAKPKLEVKARRGQQEIRVEGCPGVVEEWVKWSWKGPEPLDSGRDSSPWVTVHKKRYQWKYSFDGGSVCVLSGSDKVERGGAIEVTALMLAGKPYWSAAAESFEHGDDATEMVRLAAARLIVAIPRLRDGAGESFGYARWLALANASVDGGM